MLQRVVAVALAVLGLGVLGLGLASGTVWAPDPVVNAEAPTVESATLLVTDPGVLDLVDSDVRISATRADGGPVSLAIGREADVLGWIGEDAHVRVSGLANWTTLATVPVPGENDRDKAGAFNGPDPIPSDLWLVSATGEGSATLTWDGTPGRYVLLAAGTGDDAVAPVLALSWDREVTTPLMVPGIVLGALMLLAAVGVFLLAIRNTPAPARLDTVSAARTPRPARPVKGPDGFIEVAPETAAEPSAQPAAVPTAAPTAVRAAEPTTARAVLPTAEGAAEPAAAERAAAVPAGAEPAAPEPESSTTSTTNTVPMSRRELRELAEREAALAASSRKESRRNRRRRQENSDDGSDSPEAANAPKSAGWSPRSALAALTGSQPIVAAPQAAPEPDEDAGASNRADAWRKAWGFDGMYLPADLDETPDTGTGTGTTPNTTTNVGADRSEIDEQEDA